MGLPHEGGTQLRPERGTRVAITPNPTDCERAARSHVSGADREQNPSDRTTCRGKGSRSVTGGGASREGEAA